MMPVIRKQHIVIIEFDITSLRGKMASQCHNLSQDFARSYAKVT